MRHHEKRAAPVDAGGEPAEAGALDDALEAAADRLTLWPAIASLNERDRTIMILHYREDMTVTAIARAIDMPTGTVKVKLLRIRDKLRAGLTA